MAGCPVSTLQHHVHRSKESSPGLDTRDFLTFFSNPTHDTLRYWFDKGERAVWPYIPLIRSRTEVERCLDDLRAGPAAGGGGGAVAAAP
jgi:hypothetical protein